MNEQAFRLNGDAVMKRVVKVGGRAQSDPALIGTIASAVEAGDSVCLVHGGGDEVSALQRRLGMEPKFIGGRRVTSEADLEIVRMVLSGTTNKRLVAQMVTAGIRAVGVSGEDAGMFRAEIVDPQMGRVGERVAVDESLIEHLLSGGYVPIVSPLARDAAEPDGGRGLNVNGDDAAAALAVAVRADDLVFVADVPGVLDGDVLIASLECADAKKLIARGVITGGMAAKLEAAEHAIRGGVKTVRIAGVAGIGDVTSGTRVLSSPLPVR